MTGKLAYEGSAPDCTEETHSEPDTEETESRRDAHSGFDAAQGNDAQDCIAEHGDSKPRSRRCTMTDLDCDEQFFYGRFGHPAPIITVNHAKADDLFALRDFRRHRAKVALASFMARWDRNLWMRGQALYRERAALAAAHAALRAIRINQTWHDIPSNFDAIGLLNCGGTYETDQGKKRFYPCRQREYCPPCNLWQRVEPAKAEFVPAFPLAAQWFSISIVGVSDPEEAGIKLHKGMQADGTPIIDYLFRLSDFVHGLPRRPRFSLEHIWDAATLVAEGVFAFAKWGTDNSYFGGLHMVADCSFTFYPDKNECLQIGHTFNPHAHGYGNLSRDPDKRWAKGLYRGGIKSFARCGALDFAYPDILLRPALGPTGLESAINYVLKCFKVPEFYLTGLSNGCPVDMLNHVFHQTVYGCEALFPTSWSGEKYGNMNLKSKRYIGNEMSPMHIRELFNKGEEAENWEIDRYFRHLDKVARDLKRKGINPSE
jgi:hypothetical protein